MRGSGSSWKINWPPLGGMEVKHEQDTPEASFFKFNENNHLCLSGPPTNIYIQGLDTVTQLSSEIRVLKEENLSLQSRLQASTGTHH